MRASLDVADIFRAAGPTYRVAQAGHLSLLQVKVMTAIENCRTAALGGHVEACTDCGHWRIAYNSCRHRHCPECQGAAARTWLAERKADLLPVDYFHVVFTLPAKGFHRIPHYGRLAGSACKASIARARQLLDVAPPPDDTERVEPANVRPPCPCCGGPMVIIEAFERWQQPRAPLSSPAPIRELVS